MLCQCKAIKCRACTPAGCKRAAVTVVDGVSVCQLCSPSYRASTITALEAPAKDVRASGNYCSVCNVHDQWCEHIQPPLPPKLCRMCGTENHSSATACSKCGSIYLARVLPQFVGVGCSVMRGSEHICAAKSGTMARRIAAALNAHAPNERGV